MKVIKKYFIKKIVVTSMSLFLLVLFIVIPTNKKNKINIKKEINNKTIYLIDKDNYTSLVFCFYDEKSIENEIYKKIDLLKNGVKNFKGIIPSNVELNSLKIDKNNVYLDFNDNFLKIKNINKVYECIVYSLCEINGINNIYISVNNKMVDNMPLNKSIGINKEYNFDNFDYYDKTIVFFAKDDYYVPITKISNKKEEKVKIIIKELKSSVNSLNNLVGYLTDDIELLDYSIKDNKMELIFNKFIFADERIKYLLTTSIFANYDIEKVFIYNSDKSISLEVKNDLIFKEY